MLLIFFTLTFHSPGRLGEICFPSVFQVVKFRHKDGFAEYDSHPTKREFQTKALLDTLSPSKITDSPDIPNVSGGSWLAESGHRSFLLFKPYNNFVDSTDHMETLPGWPVPILFISIPHHLRESLPPGGGHGAWASHTA